MNWTKLWANQSPRELLRDILSSQEGRETILGVLDSLAPSKEQMERDAARVMAYSKTRDYSVFAKEMWSEIIKSIDKLTSDNLSERQVDFYRGKLSASFDFLRISYMARNAKERFEQERKQALFNK